MGRIERDHNRWLPPQESHFNVDTPTTKDSSPTQSGFCLKFLVLVVACNLMMGMAVLGTLGDGQTAFGFELIVFLVLRS
jgi:hypothetical protein